MIATSMMVSGQNQNLAIPITTAVEKLSEMNLEKANGGKPVPLTVIWEKLAAISDMAYCMSPYYKEISKSLLDKKANPQNVRRSILEAFLKFPSSSMLIDSGGMYLLKSGDYQTALTFFEKGHRLFPASISYLIEMGKCHEGLFQLDKAAEKYFQAVEVAPKQPDGFISLGNLAWDQKRHNDAKKYFRRAIDISPNNESAILFYLTLLKETGSKDEYDKAIIELQERTK